MSAYTALYRTWRPRSFAEMVGQEHVLRALVNALSSGRVHHAFLFAGTRGVGKTTVARLLAKCLNCERGVSATPCGECASCRDIDAGRSVDLIEVDAASRTRVDDTRELLDNVQYAPTSSRYKIYLIDEVHMLSAHSFNALLKTLEEPPPHVKFLLATTDPQKLPVTVLSRCLQFNLKRLSVALIGGRLRHILQAEGIEFEPAAVQLLAHAGDGSMRDALSLLDQLLAYGDGRVLEVDTRAMLGTVEREHVVRIAELLERVAHKQLVAGFEGDELHPPELLERLAQLISPEDVQLFYQTAILGRRDLGLAPDARTGFRMTLIRMLAFRPASASASAPPSAPGLAGSQSQSSSSPPSVPPPSVPVSSDVASAATAAQRSPAAQDWPVLIEQMGLQGATRQLAANCVWLGREGATVRLALDASAGTLHTSPKAAKLEQALSRHLGEPVRLQIELIDAPPDTLARSLEQAAAARVAQARAAFEADPVVGAFKERFGASVLPESVRPVESDE